MFKNSKIVSKTKVIPLFSSMPADAIQIRLASDSSFTCYFDRKEWSDHVDSITVNSKLKTDYFDVLDKIQKRDGVINTDAVPICQNDPTCLNAHRVTLDIIDKLFLKGHLSIKYPNGTFVVSLLYIKETDKTVEKQYYKDQASGKVLRYVARDSRWGL
jgi:hypothetical protein